MGLGGVAVREPLESNCSDRYGDSTYGGISTSSRMHAVE